MSATYPNGNDDSFENSISSPVLQSHGPASGRTNALSNKITNVLSRPYADPEIREALSMLAARGVKNDANTRRRLRLDAQKEVIECNGMIVQEFGLVAEVIFLHEKHLGMLMIL
jgi:conserved oligomeric Golgi complex subunit 6